MKSITTEDSMILVLLGPPGAGKGTQAERLQETFNLVHVASGDLFRENLREKTELGKLAQKYMDRGELVPDDVTIGMIRSRLEQPDAAEGVILDGFPRTIAQARGLDEMLDAMDRELSAVLHIAVPDEELIRRLSGRWICEQCQTPYHVLSNPPREAGICDVCGGKLYQREDDKPETVRARLKVYHEQTSPLIEFYRKADLLREVDGSGGIDEVWQALKKIVEDLG
ncbi:MAG: adenylate kinase [Anaerolineales bacterium]